MSTLLVPMFELIVIDSGDWYKSYLPCYDFDASLLIS
jgi:hypothetical protein